MLEHNKIMQNREVSWLRFNERVLEEAEGDSTPLIEKLKFVSIFTSNLDEFFMIRVGSLKAMELLKENSVFDSKTNMTATEQLNHIFKLLPAMYKKRDRIFNNIENELVKDKLFRLSMEELDESLLKEVERYYKNKIIPTISPQIIDEQHPFPFIENKKLYVMLEFDIENGGPSFGLVPIRDDYDPYLILNTEYMSYVLTEDIVTYNSDSLFEGKTIKSKALICVTRNFDLDEDPDYIYDIDNYKNRVKKILKKRKRQGAVRMEVRGTLSDEMLSFLTRKLKISKEQVFKSEIPLKMSYVFPLLSEIPTSVKNRLSYDEYSPYKRLEADEKNSIIDKIKEKDELLSYPYDNMDSFLEMMKEASIHPEVMSIKITIYRLARNSKLVNYLCQASENGKEVTVFMELKARFDEENNINYSEILYGAGCNIIYGFEYYKVHSKLCLITMKNEEEEINYIAQIGTGNYNETTSKIYTDFSLITADKEIGEDAADFFKNMSIGNLNGKYDHLLQAPSTLKKRFLSLINDEIKKGTDGRILFKMNSLTDKDFILKLSEASKAGVKVRMIIRGICCLLPGVLDETVNIEVHSIVGRFLEHSRVFCFGEGKEAKIYISSADLMTRNTENRVEVAAPVYDLKLKKRIVNYLEKQWEDNLKGRKILKNGTLTKIKDVDKIISSQDFFINEAKKNSAIKREKLKKIKEKEKLAVAEIEEKIEKIEVKEEKKMFKWLRKFF